MDRFFWSAFFDGFTGGGLLEGLKQPGAPKQLFADPVPGAADAVDLKTCAKPSDTDGPSQ
jgi:hypothetical protein